MEKYLLRKAYDGMNLLPDDVLWRSKEGMSDGVSSQTKPWYEIIQNNIDGLITDQEFIENKGNYNHNPPQIKEAYYYRKIFDTYLNDRGEILPYYWLPKWSGDIVDPSARVLKVYKETSTDVQLNNISS